MSDIKGVITSIKASSRASIKRRDNYFTVEYTEERSVPEDCDIEAEKQALWEAVNREIDYQVEDIWENTK